MCLQLLILQCSFTYDITPRSWNHSSLTTRGSLCLPLLFSPLLSSLVLPPGTKSQSQTSNSEFFHCHLPPSTPAHRELLKTFSTLKKLNTYCCCSVTRSCLILCNPMGCSTPGFPVLHHLPEVAQIHVHWVDDVIQPSHPLSSPSPPALNLSQDQGLF